MRRKVFWITITILAILVMALLSCTTSTTSSIPGQTQTTTQSSTSVISQTTSSMPTTGAPPTTTKANWWDKFGAPQYGGTITQRTASLSPNFDNSTWFFNELNFFWETMFVRVNWTTDRSLWAFNIDFTPEKYCTGQLAESYEINDLQTITVHIRKGVHFQNKAPVNGRELNADDVQQHYDKILGTGSGYTEPEAMYNMFTGNFEKVTAIDNNTVVYKFKKGSAFNLLSVIEPNTVNAIEAPEWVALGGTPSTEPAASAGGPLADWRNAVGSGAWMLTDYLDSSSMTFNRNPDYWGRDERYPENEVPYADTLKLTCIPDASTALAGLRTGKIDFLGADWRQKATLDKDNPDLQWGTTPGGATGLQYRCDVEPFKDFNVRKALQMSIDRKAMAQSLYGGTVDGTPSGMVSPALIGYAYDYKDWPQELKDEYGYNPTKAKQLLADAGYPNGFTTNTVTSGTTGMEVLEAIKAYFLEVGVDMEIKPMDWAQYGSFVSTGKHDQMCTQGSAMTWPPNRTLPMYDSRSPENSSYNNSAEYDDLIDKFWAATTADEIAAVTRAADKLFVEQHWQLVTFTTVSYNGWQPWLKGYSGETHTAWGGGYLYARLWVDKN